MKSTLKVTLVLMLVATMLLAACAAPQTAAPAAEDNAAAPAAADTAAAPAEADNAAAPATEDTAAAPTADTGLGCQGMKLGLVTTVGGLGDNAIGDAVYNAIIDAQKELGFEFDYMEPRSGPDYESMLIEYAESGEYDLVFLSGNDGLDPVTAVGPDYPDQKFILYDVASEGNDQYVSEYYAKNEIGFLAGVLAALMEEKGEVTVAGTTTTFTPTGKIGLIIGVETPSTVPAITGAAAGIKYVKPDYEYLYGIVGDWSDQVKNKELALSMYDQGAHFIFPNAGGGGYGIIAAAQERDAFYIGYDLDQTNRDPERVIASVTKSNNAVIRRILKQYCETGNLAWGVAEENNIANDGIGVSYNPDFIVPPDVAATLDKVIAALKEGTIKAPNTWDEVDAFNDVYEP